MADICDYCYRKPAVTVCVSHNLFGGECVMKRCEAHTCPCDRGEKMSLAEFNALEI